MRMLVLNISGGNDVGYRREWVEVRGDENPGVILISSTDDADLLGVK